MMRERFARAMLAACFTLTILGACSIKSETAPSNFYMLNSMSTEAATGGAQSGLSDLELALGPVSVPAYLDRPQIVTRGLGNEVTLSEFDRWAEPLKDNITSVLTDNLSRLLRTERLSVYPSSLARDLDLRVTLEVIRFDGSLGGDIVLDARGSVFSCIGVQ